MGIPLFYGATRAKVKAARKEREMIALEIKEQEQLRQQEYLSALSRMNAAYVRYTYYNEEGRERSDKMAEQGLLEYSQGEISYLEYMNVLQESIDLRLKRASALNDYNQCVLVMEKLCGRQLHALCQNSAAKHTSWGCLSFNRVTLIVKYDENSIEMR